MAQYLLDLGAVFTALTGHFASVLTLFTTEPVLMLVSGIMITGAVIGLVSRLINR